MSAPSERNPTASDPHWRGDVLLWDEQALFIGKAADTGLHESPAIKICIALADDFLLKTGEDSLWQPFSAAIIAPGQYHAINGRQNDMAMLVTVPEAELAQPINPLFDESGVIELSYELSGKLQAIFADRENNGSTTDESICPQMMQLIRREMSPDTEAGLDPRVAKSIEWIRTGREEGISVKEIAAGVDLSESRFSHLFTENVRIPVRRYLLWLRLRDAIHLLAAGVSLTNAAYDAGFADSSHLTRTFRGMLGITPSALVKESKLTSYLS